MTDITAAAAVLFDISLGDLVDGPAPAVLRAYDGAAPRDGLALQLAVLSHWEERGERVGGWKVAWTSRAMRDRGGKDFRPFGYILASRIVPSGSTVVGADVPNGLLEAEICLTIGTRLSGVGVTRDEAKAAVASVAPAFEINSRRLPEGVDIPVRIGNGMNNWGLVVGPAADASLPLDGLTVTLRRDGEEIATNTTGPDVLDDPYLSLARVAGELDRFGLALEPGQQVITGSVIAGTPMVVGSTYEASFGPLGSVVATVG